MSGPVVPQAASWQGNNPVSEEISVSFNLFPALASFSLSVVRIYPTGLLCFRTVPISRYHRLLTTYYLCGLCEVWAVQAFEVWENLHDRLVHVHGMVSLLYRSEVQFSISQQPITIPLGAITGLQPKLGEQHAAQFCDIT